MNLLSFVRKIRYLVLVFCGLLPSAVFGQTAENNQAENRNSYNPAALDHYMRAMKFEEEGDNASAILEYQDAIANDSTASVFYYSIGECYLKLRPPKAVHAVGMFEKYLEMEPRDINVHQRLANIYRVLKQFNNAERIMERMRWLNTFDLPFYLDLMKIYLLNGKDKKAADLSRELMNSPGAGDEIVENVKGIYINFKKMPDGIALFEQLTLEMPKSGLFKYGLGDLYLQMGDSLRGRKHLEESLELEPDLKLSQQRLSEIYLAMHLPEKVLPWFDAIDIRHQMELAHFYFAADNDSIAAPLFRRVMKQNPEDPRSYLYLGIISMRKPGGDLEHRRQDLKLSSELFTQAVSRDSTRDIYHYYAGQSFLRLDEFDKAILHFTKAAEINSSDPKHYFWLGLSYFRQKKYDESIKSIERVLAINPDDLDAMDLLSDGFFNLGKFDRAEEMYRRLIEADSTNIKALNNYGYMLAEQGRNLEEALQLSRRAVEGSPDNASYLDTLGWIYYKLGRYQEALDYLHKAAKPSTDSIPLSPDHLSVVYDHIGDVYYKMGEEQKARFYWQKVLDIDRENKFVRKKLDDDGSNQ